MNELQRSQRPAWRTLAPVRAILHGRRNELHKELPPSLVGALEHPDVIWCRHGVKFFNGALGSSPGPRGQARTDAIHEWFRRLRPGGIIVIEEHFDMEFEGANLELMNRLEPTLVHPDRDAFVAASAARVLYSQFPKGQVRWRLWRTGSPWSLPTHSGTPRRNDSVSHQKWGNRKYARGQRCRSGNTGNCRGRWAIGKQNRYAVHNSATCHQETR